MIRTNPLPPIPTAAVTAVGRVYTGSTSSGLVPTMQRKIRYGKITQIQ